MFEVIFRAIWHALRAAYAAFDHAAVHVVLWLTEADTFRFGACYLCSPARTERACERRQAATGRYHR